MTSSSIKTIGVIGTGVIGASWTALFLAKGLKVIATDPAPDAEEKILDYLSKTCPTISNGVNISENFLFVRDIIPYLQDVDMIQENGPERLDWKRQFYCQLDANTPDHVIIASSSSGLPSSEFVTDCKKNPSRILIGHPFNPPHLVPLVEVVPHQGTGSNHVEKALEFYKDIGKEPVLVKSETPGFIANRLQAAVCREAYSLVSRGIVSAKDLDKTMTSGLGLRWAITGPIMTNVLGGGGSFEHFMQHLGPAMNSWTEDMDKNKFDMTSQESVSVLSTAVDEWVSGVDLEKVKTDRDTHLAKLGQ